MKFGVCLLALIVIPCWASAGQYVLDEYTGGNVSVWVKRTNQTYPDSYEYNSLTDWYEGGGDPSNPPNGPTYMAGEPGTVNCSGPVSVSFTWSGVPGEPKPPALLIKREVIASWTGNSGTCSNAIGGPPGMTLPGGKGQTDHETLYEVITGPGETVTVPVTGPFSPSAFGSLPSRQYYNGDLVSCSSSIKYRVSVEPLEIVLDGGIPDGYSRKYLVGQRVTANISSSLTGGTRSWSTSNCSPFFSYNPSLQSAVLNASVPLNNLTFITHYADSGTVNLSCSANLSVPAGSLPATGVPVSLTKAFTVVKPSYAIDTGFPRIGKVLADASGTGLVEIYGVTDEGFELKAKVTTPSAFFIFSGGSTDRGGWNTVQTISPLSRFKWQGVKKFRRYMIVIGPPPTYTASYVTSGLDSLYPYQPSGSNLTEFTADGTWNISDDTAGDDIEAGDTKFDVKDEFEHFIMYRAPGSTSQFVPLHVVKYFWNAKMELVGGSWIATLSGTSTLARDITLNQPTSTHPIWSNEINILASPWREES